MFIPLDLIIQSFIFWNFTFFEFEYQVFEYFKDFKSLFEKLYAFISLLQKTFWRLVQIKEHV